MNQLPWAFFLVLFLSSRVGADVAELQQAVKETIKKAEPSIACILVSRSEQYKRYERGQAGSDKPGWLGDFERIRPRHGFHGFEEEDPRLKLDMSSPDYV